VKGGSGGMDESWGRIRRDEIRVSHRPSRRTGERMKRWLSTPSRLRLRDYGRVDLRVTPAEEIYVIEVNPNCYLEQTGEFARAAAESGIGARCARRAHRGVAQGRYTR